MLNYALATAVLWAALYVLSIMLAVWLAYRYVFCRRWNPYYRAYISYRSLFLIKRDERAMWITRDEEQDGDEFLGRCVPGVKHRQYEYIKPGHRRSPRLGFIPKSLDGKPRPAAAG